MLYLYLLHTKNTPLLANRNRAQAVVTEIQNMYRQRFEGAVQFLGGQILEGALPTGPDTFVVATCLMACEKKGVKFDTQRDEISYSVDSLEGTAVGVCRIKINSPETIAVTQQPSATVSEKEKSSGLKKWWQFWK